MDQAKSAIVNLDRYSENKFQKKTDEILKDLKGEPMKLLRYLDGFNQWLAEDHPDIVFIDKRGNRRPIKKKHPHTIHQYHSVARRYAKLCHAIRLNDDDIKEYITFPDLEADEEEAEPFTPQELRLVLDSTLEQRRKTLYMVMKDAGGRIKENGQLKKENFDFAKDPVEVTFPKSIVKGKIKTRRAFLTKETAQRVKLLLKSLTDSDFVFKNPDQTPIQFRENEGQIFRKITSKLGFNEKYEHNGRYKKNLHSIRAFCSTEYSIANNSEEAGHGYIGHKKYLEQYIRLSDQQKIDRFRRAEQRLNLYDSVIVVENTDQKILELQKQFDEIKRMFQHSQTIE